MLVVMVALEAMVVMGMVLVLEVVLGAMETLAMPIWDTAQSHLLD
jgi:hypothetical protein